MFDTCFHKISKLFSLLGHSAMEDVSAAQDMASSSPVKDPNEKEDAPDLTEINNSRANLLSRVQNLKKDLQDWRGKLDSQVKNYRQELVELRSSLNSEVEQLRNEFQDLRSSLKKQLSEAPDTEKPPVS